MRLWRCRACKINQKTKRAPFLDLFKRESPGTRGQARAHRRDTRKGDKQRKGKSQRGRRRAARQTRRACFEEKQRRTVEPKGNVNSKGKAQLAAGARRTASGFGFDCLLSDTKEITDHLGGPGTGSGADWNIVSSAGSLLPIRSRFVSLWARCASSK